MLKLALATLAAAAVAVVLWGALFVVALDEDCGRLNECELPPDVLYVAALAGSAVAVALAAAWLYRLVRRSRR